jgi:hypothetical protein
VTPPPDAPGPGPHRYRTAELIGDYGRGASGRVLTALPLVAVPMPLASRWFPRRPAIQDGGI